MRIHLLRLHDRMISHCQVAFHRKSDTCITWRSLIWEQLGWMGVFLGRNYKEGAKILQLYFLVEMSSKLRHCQRTYARICQTSKLPICQMLTLWELFLTLVIGVAWFGLIFQTIGWVIKFQWSLGNFQVFRVYSFRTTSFLEVSWTLPITLHL